MGYRSYTSGEIKPVKSCQEPLKIFVEQYISARERVRIMLKPVRDLIGEGLKRGTPKAKLLNKINESDELKNDSKISEAQFRRYLLEEFPELMARGSSRRANSQKVAASMNADEFRVGVTKTIEERRNRV